MTAYPDVLCAGIIVADHVCTPIAHLPAAGELVMAERILLTIGGCAANVAVDLGRGTGSPPVCERSKRRASIPPQPRRRERPGVTQHTATSMLANRQFSGNTAAMAEL